jgi:hypothetical protein
MNPEDSPAYRWARYHYEKGQREWHEELFADPPDWNQLEDIDQQLRSLEAYLAQIDLDAWL